MVKSVRGIFDESSVTRETLKFLRSLAVISFVLVTCTVFSVLNDVSYTTTADEIVLIVSFTAAPKVELFSQNQSKTVHFFLISDKVTAPSYLPVGIGSVEGVQVIPIDGQANIFVYTITPISPKYNVTGSKLYIRFPRSMSAKRITANFMAVRTDVLFKELSDYFGLDIFLYDGAKNKTINIKLTNASVEDVIRSVLSVSGLSYAYGSGGVLYFGTPEEISRNFAAAWHVAEGTLDPAKLQNLLRTGTYAGYSRDRSKLFVYGGVKEYKIVADALSAPPEKKWQYVAYPSGVTENDMGDFLKRLTNIYSFEYVLFPNQVALAGTHVQEVAAAIRAYKPVQKPQATQPQQEQQVQPELRPSAEGPGGTARAPGGGGGAAAAEAATAEPAVGAVAVEKKIEYVSITAEFPEQLSKALSAAYPEAKFSYSGNVVFVPKEYESLARTLLESSTVGNPYRLTLENVSEQGVKGLLAVLGVNESNYKLAVSGNKIFLTLFVDEKIYQRFVRLVEVIEEDVIFVRMDEAYLKYYNVSILDRFSDGSLLVAGKKMELERLKNDLKNNVVSIPVKVLPTDPPINVVEKLLKKTLEVEVEVVDGMLIFTVSRFRIAEFEKALADIRENYGKKLVVTPASLDEQTLQQILSTVEKIFGKTAEILRIDNNLVILGTHAVEAQKFMETFSKVPGLIVFETPKLSSEMRSLLEKVLGKKIEILDFGGFSYVVGRQSDVDIAKEYIAKFASEIVDFGFELKKVLADYLKSVFGVEVEEFRELGKLKLTGPKAGVEEAKKFLSELSRAKEFVVETVQVGSQFDVAKFEELAAFLKLDVKLKKIGDLLYLSGSKSDVDGLKSEIVKHQVNPDRKFLLLRFDPKLLPVAKSIYSLEIYELSDGFLAIGSEAKLSEFVNFLKILDSGSASSVVFSSDRRYALLQYPDDLDGLIKKEYGVETYKTERGYVVFGTNAQLERVSSFLRDTLEATNVTVSVLQTDLKKEQIELIVSIFDKSVKFFLVDRTLYLIGRSESLKTITSEIAKFIPQSEYNVVAGKLVIDVKEKPIKDLILEASKYLGSEVLVLGNLDSKVSIRLVVLSQEELLNYLRSFGVRYDRFDYVYRVFDTSFKYSPDNIITAAGTNTANIFVKEQPLKDVLFTTAQILREQIVVESLPNVTVTLNLKNVTFEEFLKTVQSKGVVYQKVGTVYYLTSEVKVSEQAMQAVTDEVIDVRDGRITIKVTDKRVDEVIRQVLLKLGKSFRMESVQEKVYSLNLVNVDFETFKMVFSEWVQFSEREGIVHVTAAKRSATLEEREKVRVVDQKISIDIEDQPISDVIRTVFQKLGYSLVFAKPIDKKATMTVKDIDFETFKSIILNYGVTLKESGSLYVVDTTPESTQVHTTYTFNVVRGADKVKELIEFYGGKAIVNTDAGIIIAYNLDPKNVSDIQQVIDRISKARLVSIEARVVDSSLINSLGMDLGLKLKSANVLEFSPTGSLSLTLNVLDLLDFATFWEKLLDKMEFLAVSKFSSTEGVTRLLASPNVLAKSGEEAKVFIGDSIPVIRKDTEGREAIDYIEAGIELRILPKVNPDNTIELELYTSVSNFDYATRVGQFPRTSKREASTKVTINSGQTLVIGGLSREEKTTQSWKLPVLGDLPLFGFLFRGTTEAVETRNIVLFLTAKIVD